MNLLAVGCDIIILRVFFDSAAFGGVMRVQIPTMAAAAAAWLTWCWAALILACR